MLNIFKLTDAISESAVGISNIAGIQPYEFIGSMAECTAMRSCLRLPASWSSMRTLRRL